MAEKVSPIPPGYHTVTPYLTVNDGNRALAFYQQALGAIVIHHDTAPNGRFLNAGFRIGDSMLMMGEHPKSEVPAAENWLDEPNSRRVSIYLYVEDADALHSQALAAGAQEISPVSTKFYGNCEGGVADPFGIIWWIATRVEDPSPEEMEQRLAALERQRQ